MISEHPVQQPRVSGEAEETLVPPYQVSGVAAKKRRGQAAALRDAFLPIAVFIFALSQFLPAVDDREFHRDEARWIHRGVYIEQFFDPFGEVWNEQYWFAQGGNMDEQFRLRAQPPLGSYVMGIGFLLQGEPVPDIGFWNMDQDNGWNIAEGNMPSEDQLHTGRRTNAFVGAFTVVAVFFIANRLSNALGGVIAAVFLAAHPLMIYISTFAGSDAVLGLTIVLAAVAAYRFADRPSWPRAILLGVMIGLGGSAKLSPMGISAALAAMGALLILIQVIRRNADGDNDLPPYTFGWQLISTPIVAALTLVASYPYLWRDPIDNTMNLLDYRTYGMELQSFLWSGIAVNGPVEALQRIGRRLGGEMTLLGRIGDAFPAGIELAIASAGLVLMLLLVMKRGIWSGTGLAVAVLTSELAITVIGLKADWARYHLPVLLLVAVCIGVVAGILPEMVRRCRDRVPMHEPAHSSVT
jgi:hypothetical protein